MDEEREIPVRVTSMYGARTKQPIVTLVVGDMMHQFTPDEAREMTEAYMQRLAELSRTSRHG